eukprot:6247207-Prymnesium_polylepis.2
MFAYCGERCGGIWREVVARSQGQETVVSGTGAVRWFAQLSGRTHALTSCSRCTVWLGACARVCVRGRTSFAAFPHGVVYIGGRGGYCPPLIRHSL